MPYYSLRLSGKGGPGGYTEPISLDAETDDEALARTCQQLKILELTLKAFEQAGGNQVVKWNGDRPTVIYPQPAG